jgi:hypothetical protein
MSLLIFDLDFIEENSKSISGGMLRTAPGISTAISTDLDTGLLTFLDIKVTPEQIDIVQIAVGSGAGAGAAAAAVKGRAIARSLAIA